MGDLLRKPEEARARQLEIDREVERDTLLERLLERGGEREVELGRQENLALLDAQRRRDDGDIVRAGRAGD